MFLFSFSSPFSQSSNEITTTTTKGLDAAGPGFTWPFDFGTHFRLDPTDARYVQCIYTSRLTLGTAKECGHGNFIMNGGIE